MVVVGRLSLAVVLIAGAGSAVAQAPAVADGHVSAFACQALPSPLQVELEAGDGRPGSERLRAALLRALSRRHVTVAPGARFRLGLYVDAVREAETHKGRDLGRFSRGNASDKRTQFRINLWSNRRDSVIGGRRDEVLHAAVDELHVEITLDDRSDGQCVWQGKAVHNLDGHDELDSAERMIPLLVQRLGRSAGAEPIRIDWAAPPAPR